ncbi:MAG: beta-N-acetylhexosaminidase [Parachlamydiaceae bacterium]
MYRLFFCYFFCFLQLLGHFDIDRLSLEEKVGQLLVVHFRGETFNQEASRLLSEVYVGGFVLFPWANGLHSKEQTKELTALLQSNSATPLFIAVDQEGGRVKALKDSFVALPSQKVQARNKDQIRHLTREAGNEMRSIGINTNFSPVVDIDSNPLNPIIGDRSFSHLAEEVIACANEAIQGYQEAHLLCCLKHFPGHGDVSIDSHQALPLIDKNLDELNHLELAPFLALHQNVDLIMTGHLLVPKLDPEQPATFSSNILQNLLRKQWGYQGLVISDSLIMGALSQRADNLQEAALLALKAGCDLLCIAGKVNKEGRVYEPNTDEIVNVHQFLVKAIIEGRISEEQIDQSVQKILQTKEKYQVFR